LNHTTCTGRVVGRGAEFEIGWLMAWMDHPNPMIYGEIADIAPSNTSPHPSNLSTCGAT